MNRLLAMTLMLGIASPSLHAQVVSKKPAFGIETSPFGISTWTEADMKAFEARRAKQIQSNKLATTKIIQDCDAATKKGDIENRGILSEVRMGMGDTCKIQSPINNLDSFMKDVKKVARGVDQNKIWDDTTKIALEKAIEGLLALHIRVVDPKNGPLTAAKAEAIICGQAKLLCAAGRPELPLIKKSIADFLARNKKNPIQYLDGAKQEVLKADFNNKVNLANQTCALTKKKYHEIKMAYSCVNMPDLSQLKLKKLQPGEKPEKFVFKPMKPVSEMECNDRLDKAYAKHKQLESMARESIMLNMQLLVSSELGPLFATKSFRKKVGTLTPDFVYESCMKGDGHVLNNAWHGDINEGRVELYNLALKELKTIEHKRIIPPQYVDKEDELEKYLKTNPLTISELLKRSADPTYAKAICFYVKDIHRSDKISNYIDTGLMALGVVSSIAFGFATGGAGFAVLTPAATALAAISIGSTALVITKNAVDYHTQLREDQANRQSIATQQRNLDNGIQALEASDKKKEALLSNMKWSAAGLVLEVAGLGFAMKKATTLINDLKKSPALFEMVEGSTQTAKATTLHKGSQSFTKFVKALDPTKVGPLKDLSPDKQTKLAAIFSTLDDAKGKLLVEKLSKLSPEEFTKFFKVLDDANMAKVSSKLIVASLDDFSKTGTVKKIKVPLTPEDIAKLGPKIPKDANSIVVVYPESSRAIKALLPEATPVEIKKLISTTRKQFGGMVKDDEIAMMVERFSLDGSKTSPEILKKFQNLTALKQKHIDLFQPNGVMNSPAFKNEGDLTKLAYLDELEKNGVPLRNSHGELILSAEQTVMRKKISNLSITARMEAIQKEMNFVARQNPCSL